MSDSNRVRVAFKEESTYGTAPSGTLSEIRLTSESVHQETSTTQSAEVRNDRQIPGVIRTNLSVSGDIAFELSYGSFDTFVEFALCSSGYSTGGSVGVTTISAASSDNSFNDSGSGFGALVAGQWIRVSGFTNAANNGVFKIVSKTSSKIVVSQGTLTTESAGNNVSIDMGEQVVNGTTFSSFSMERKYEDLTNVYARYVGCAIEGMSLSMSAESIITGSFSIIGQSETSETTSFGSSYASAGDGTVLNCIDHVTKTLIDGTDTGITSFSFTMKNNLRGRMEIGALGPVSIGMGSVEVTGTLQAYFSSAALLDKYLNFDTVALAVVIEDPDTGVMVWEFPAVKLTSGQRVTPGQNQDIIADLQFTAFREATTGVTVRYTRIDNS